jgi:signal transduction histidine kinase
MNPSTLSTLPVPGRSRVTAWVLVHLTRKPAWSRVYSFAIIAAVVLLIGGIDFLLGVKISLRVFYFIPIALAVGWLGWWEAVGTSIASVAIWFLGDWFDGADYVRRPEVIWNASIILSMYLVVAWILEALIALHRQMEGRVRERTAAFERESRARVRLQRDLLRISERERSSIGQDLHDGLCQHLAGTALAGQVLVEQLSPRDPEAAESARGIVRLLQDGIVQTRHLARGLLLATIEPERLVAELDELATTVERQSGVPCRFTLRGNPDPADHDTASHLFRIAQEAVRNAVRHARPKRLEIVLEGDGDDILLQVSDDGTGLPASRRGPGMGLRIMAQRAQLMRAEFAVEASHGGGTRVRCRVPARGGVPV